MALAALAINWMSFRRLAPWFGEAIEAGTLDQPTRPAMERRALQIRQLITTIGGNAPFRSDCFPQALVSVWLCRLYGLPYALFFGVALTGDRDENTRDLKAHAWVMSGDVALSGGTSSFQKFRTLACYVGNGIAAAKGRRYSPPGSAPFAD